VSKLCCPVCWELLKILRNNDSTDLYVDGHHATLFQVELPEWLPLDSRDSDETYGSIRKKYF
jgi:hypothetical protein